MANGATRKKKLQICVDDDRDNLERRSNHELLYFKITYGIFLI